MLTEIGGPADLDPVGSSSVRAPRRHLIVAAVILAMGWVAFHAEERIPLLTWINLGVHELAHLLTRSLPELTMMMSGSIAQVAVPVLIAAYFLILRNDWAATALFTAWGATSAAEVAVYVADAPERKLALIGDRHDWAYILGPNGYGAMDRAPWLADTITHGAMVAMVVALGLCVAGVVRGQLSSTAPASASSATSSP